MLYCLHWILMAMYIAAPAVATGHAVVHLQRGSVRAFANLLLTMTVGVLLGTAATVVWAYFADGQAPWTQFLLTSYFASAMLLILKGFDTAMKFVFRWLVHQMTGERSRDLVSLTLVRGVLLIGIGMPYILAAAMTYRPRITIGGDPQSVLKLGFTSIGFRSTDGVMLHGWWIPASDDAKDRSKTVLICPGLAQTTAKHLVLARELIPAGYNVLAMDFRGFGQSGGRTTSFGDLERKDVLAAAHWVRQEHPDQAKKIVGVGVSTGAAALIAAAADPGADGQSIEAVAVYGTYDDLNSLAGSFTSSSFPPPLDWLVRQIGMPLASLHAGTNLSQFKPAELVQQIWPRPVLIIHGTFDGLIPFDHGAKLFDAASFPKQCLWLLRRDDVGSLQDRNAASTVLDFFDNATPRPVI